jgi:hypothetical protein
MVSKAISRVFRTCSGLKEKCGPMGAIVHYAAKYDRFINDLGGEKWGRMGAFDNVPLSQFAINFEYHCICDVG